MPAEVEFFMNMFPSVRKAFWHTEATELIFIELPAKAKDPELDEVGEIPMRS